MTITDQIYAQALVMVGQLSAEQDALHRVETDPAVRHRARVAESRERGNNLCTTT